MSRRNVILVSVAVAAFALSAGLVFRWMRVTASESSDFPEGTFWVCTDSDCGAEFVLTIRELGAHYRSNPETNPPCPTCGGTQTARAMRCPRCERFFPRPQRGVRAITCPHCKTDLPRATDDGG